MKELIQKIKNKLGMGNVELIIFSLACIAFLVGVIMLAGYGIDTIKSKRASESLVEAAVTVTEVKEELPEDSEEYDEEPADELEAEVATATEQGSEVPIEVDFEALFEKNPEIKAWIYSAGTPINTAVPYRDNDLYYLCHSSTRESNRYGTIFIAAQCSPDFSEPNTVLYGHDMQNGTILGTLELYHEQEYFEEHKVMYLLTPDKNYRVEVVSGYIHTTDNELYNLPNSREFTESFVKMTIASSLFDSGKEYNPDANYLTFSTCSDDFDGARLALVCELVELD